MAIHTAVPTNTRHPTMSSAFLVPSTAELGAHAGEEQGDGEHDHGEDVVRGALDVAPYCRRHHLGLGVELLGLRLGLQLVLVHREGVGGAAGFVSGSVASQASYAGRNSGRSRSV